MYTLMKQIKDNEVLRKSFNSLAQKTFGITFEKWYQDGFWTERYVPYVFVKESKVIANVSVNLIHIMDQGTSRSYVQLGTVMTDEDYRHQGLAKLLMKEVIKDWKDQCDGIYLFANEAALEFYPKFSFIKATEYQYSFTIQPKSGDFYKLDMTRHKNQTLFKHYYALGNPFSGFALKDNLELLMFYCLDDLKDCIYYSKQFDLVLIAKQKKNTLLCYDIFGRTNASLEEITASFSDLNHSHITLGFTPKNTKGYTVMPLEENHLFITKNMLTHFNTKKMFPLLSHA